MNQNTDTIRREEVWYDSRDGVTQIHAVRWIPDCETPTAVVQLVHGMTEHILRYDPFARFLAGQGMLVVGNDHLGHGMSRRENVPYGYFCKRDPATVVVRDVHRLKKLTQSQHPGVPYLLAGHSMGSFIVRNYLSRYGSGIDGAVIIGTGYQTRAMVDLGLAAAHGMNALFGPMHVAKLLDRIAFCGYNRKFRPVITGSEWLNSAPDQVVSYADDPQCGFTFTINGFLTLFTLVKRACAQDAVRSVPKDLPVLFLSGADDPVGGFGKGVERSADNFRREGMTRVSCKLYEGLRHEILRETRKDEVYGDILRFVREAAGAPEH